MFITVKVLNKVLVDYGLVVVVLGHEFGSNEHRI